MTTRAVLSIGCAIDSKQKSRRNRSADDQDGDVALASLETRFENPEDELKGEAR